MCTDIKHPTKRIQVSLLLFCYKESIQTPVTGSDSHKTPFLGPLKLPLNISISGFLIDSRITVGQVCDIRPCY